MNEIGGRRAKNRKEGERGNEHKEGRGEREGKDGGRGIEKEKQTERDKLKKIAKEQ